MSFVFNLPELLEKYTLTGHGNTSIVINNSAALFTTCTTLTVTGISRLTPNTAVWSFLNPFPPLSHWCTWRFERSAQLRLPPSYRGVSCGITAVFVSRCCQPNEHKKKSRIGFVLWQHSAGSISDWPLPVLCFANLTGNRNGFYTNTIRRIFSCFSFVL
jgi:hypothetical protein